jgi:hypothetical protein
MHYFMHFILEITPMSRKSGIWLRKQNKTWYVNHRGKQINLGKDKSEAEKLFHKLMAEEQAELVSTDRISAVLLMDKFLLWCSDNRAPRTFDWYKDHLEKLLDHLPNQNIEASQLKPFHVYGAVKKTWSASYKRGFMVACLRWCWFRGPRGA